MMSRLDHLVADEAVGALDPARSLLIASLASMKPEIAREIRRYEAVGGALLAGFEPVSLKPGGFERILAALDQPDAAAGEDPRLAGLPEPLRGPVAEALHRNAWRWLLPGVQTLDLGPAMPRRQAGEPVMAELLRVYPGWSIPRHGHGGEELTLVLAGGFTDETGHFAAGDLAITDRSLTHHPIADPGEPCLSYIVSDTAPRFIGALGALTRAWNWVKARPA